MAKNIQIGIRIDPQTKAALEAAAMADDRTVSALVLRVLKEWLTKNAAPRKGKKP